METRNETRLVANASTHPGEILRDWLDDLGVKQKDFAASIGLPASRLNEFIRGKRAVTEDLAARLEKALGVEASFWIKAQAGYEYNERMLGLRSTEEKISDAKEASLRSMFNIKELYSRLGISAASSAVRINRLFNELGMTYEDVTNRTAIAGCFKHSDTLHIDENNIRTWVLLAQHAASRVNVSGTYSPDKAENAAVKIARMANDGTLVEAEIRSVLSDSGIVYCVEPKLQHCPVDAYSVMLGGTPAIVVTHRHNNMQKLIFDVLHEIAHILKHMKGDYSDFINTDYSQDNVYESEANAFARDILIPPAIWEKIVDQSVPSAKGDYIFSAIARKAESLGINPRIAVARYKHDSQQYNSKVYSSTKIK